MPVCCLVPGCDSYTKKERERAGVSISYHRLPTDVERCKQWLRVIKNPKYDENAPTSSLGSLRVCSLHFAEDAYVTDLRAELMGGTFRKLLNTTAVPTLFIGDIDRGEADPRELHDTWALMDRSPGQVSSTGSQENVPAETCTATTEKPTPQHIVDEEAILQLMKTCPMCDRKCRCTKYTRGPYFIVYQSCYFCSYQRKWANQPEARNMNIHKPHMPRKRKLQANDKASLNAKAPSSKLNKTSTSESSVSESHDPVET